MPDSDLYESIFSLSPAYIKTQLDTTLGESAPPFTTAKTCFSDFKRVRTSTLDAEHSGRQKSAATDEIVRKVHKTIMYDHRLKLTGVAESVDMTINSAYCVNLLDKLHTKMKAKDQFGQKESPVSPGQLSHPQAIIVIAKLRELKFEILPQAPYSPDMAPSD
ncbi:hypothetical protein HNY73_011964 [Argiope bruennichi]|uniref:Uncharacterized protein n=1 Tax=Argiope bruennichi TaxID=94029 RepID=A0A8T0EUZ9_ARGBR|nr:hypothetical protein HNY73_011964 [Argiope bruennichi]